MSDNTKTSLPKSMGERLINGIFKENPTFVLLLGMCPTLATTTSASNGLGMGLTTMVVLAMSNLIISALRKVIPNKIRIPAFIVIIASFVTIVELLLEAYIPSLYDSLGIYIPLIVVNCIILGRAEAYAYSHGVIPSLFDGIGMGLGFTVALTIIGGVREILGSGMLFGAQIMPDSYVPVSIFVMAPGAFFVLAILTAIQNKIKDIGTKRGHDMSKIQSGCGGNCMECSKECKVEPLKPSCEEKKDDVKTAEEPKKEEPKKEEAKKEELKKEEPKVEVPKAEEVKPEEDIVKEPATEDVQSEENKAETVKEEAPKAEEKPEEPKAEEIKPEESKAEEVKELAEEDLKSEASETENAKTEDAKVTIASEETATEETSTIEEVKKDVVSEETHKVEETKTDAVKAEESKKPEVKPSTMGSGSSNFLTQKSYSDKRKKNRHKHKYNFSGTNSSDKKGGSDNA